MAVVTEHLVQLIAKHLDDKGMVVWYDPDPNDGAVLDIAPLHELLPCKDAKKFQRNS